MLNSLAVDHDGPAARGRPNRQAAELHVFALTLPYRLLQVGGDLERDLGKGQQRGIWGREWGAHPVLERDVDP